MEIQVVLAEIGEGGAREPAAVDPVQGQRMAGHLHRGGVDPTLAHHREKRLQLGCLRGGAHAGNDLISDAGLRPCPTRPVRCPAAARPASSR